ncbi:MAG: hypothetical protein QXU20_03405 [Candidatus Woesearchaeota archaeon]
MASLRNKKGIGILVAIIIVLMVIFVLFIITGLLSSLSSESAKETACRSSVLKNYVGRSALSFNDAVLQCESKDISIKKDGIYVNGKKQVSYKGLSEQEAKNKTMKILADEMAKCWNMFLEGNIEYMRVLAGSKVLCNVCAKITVKDTPFKEITFEEFMDFLAENEIKDKRISYFKYLYPDVDYDKHKMMNALITFSIKLYGQAPIISIDKIDREEFNIKTNGNYYLVFTAMEGSLFRTLKHHESYVMIAPTRFLINGCSLLYG